MNHKYSGASSDGRIKDIKKSKKITDDERKSRKMTASCSDKKNNEVERDESPATQPQSPSKNPSASESTPPNSWPTPTVAIVKQPSNGP